jgi:hypothetical protein
MSAEGGRAFEREGSELRRSAAAAAGRVDEIILEAERVANNIRGLYLEERRREVGRLTDRQLARLEAALEVFRAQLGVIEQHGSATIRSIEEALNAGAAAQPADRPSEPHAGPAAAAEQAAAEAEQPDSLTGVAAYPGAEPSGGSGSSGQMRAITEGEEGAIIRATQLAINGSGRDEIIDALGLEFGLDDPAAIVDEILGPH